MEKGQNINAHWSLSKLMQAPLDDFMLAGFRTSLVEVTADVAEIARELEVKPEDVSELLRLIVKLEQVTSCLLWTSKESDFLRWNPDTAKTLEMTTKDPKHCVTFVDKAAVGFERIGSSFERSCVGECCEQRCSLQRNASRKEESVDAPNFTWSYFRHQHSHPSLPHPPP